MTATRPQVVRVRGAGGAVFEEVDTPALRKRIDRGDLTVEPEPAKPKRTQSTPSPEPEPVEPEPEPAKPKRTRSTPRS